MGVLAGKVVLVTGAGRGIGREVAVLAAAEGARVVVNDLGGDVGGAGADATPAQETAALVEAAGGEAVVNGESVADYEAAGRMVGQAVEAFGRIDGVVNVAGILRDAIFHKMTEADWDAVVSVHLKGSFNVARRAADRFRAQESGAMVHFTSTSGLVGNFGQANYAAAKMGIVGLSKSIALDMQRFNVRSNCMSPFRLDPHDRDHSRQHAAGARAHREAANAATGPDRADGGLSALRPCQRRHRPDLRLPAQ